MYQYLTTSFVRFINLYQKKRKAYCKLLNYILYGIEICCWDHGGTHCQGAELLWDELGDLATVMEGDGDLGCAASDCRC